MTDRTPTISVELTEDYQDPESAADNMREYTLTLDNGRVYYCKKHGTDWYELYTPEDQTQYLHTVRYDHALNKAKARIEEIEEQRNLAKAAKEQDTTLIRRPVSKPKAQAPAYIDTVKQVHKAQPTKTTLVLNDKVVSRFVITAKQTLTLAEEEFSKAEAIAHTNPTPCNWQDVVAAKAKVMHLEQVVAGAEIAYKHFGHADKLYN